MFKGWRFPAMLVVSALVVDRLSKLWAWDRLRPIGEIRLVPFCYLTYAENTGAAFSLLRDSNLFLTGVSVLVLGGLFYYRKEIVRDAWSRWGFWLVVSGALGNLYDRLLYGYVIDFINWRVWPIFNVADSCISVGSALLALSFLNNKNSMKRG